MKLDVNDDLILKSGLFWIEVKQKNDGMKSVLAGCVSARWSPCSVTLKAVCLWVVEEISSISDSPPPTSSWTSNHTNDKHIEKSFVSKSSNLSLIHLSNSYHEDKETLWGGGMAIKMIVYTSEMPQHLTSTQFLLVLRWTKVWTKTSKSQPLMVNKKPLFSLQ